MDGVHVCSDTGIRNGGGTEGLLASITHTLVKTCRRELNGSYNLFSTKKTKTQRQTTMDSHHMHHIHL